MIDHADRLTRLLAFPLYTCDVASDQVMRRYAAARVNRVRRLLSYVDPDDDCLDVINSRELFDRLESALVAESESWGVPRRDRELEPVAGGA